MDENRFIEIIKPIQNELNKPKVDWDKIYIHLNTYKKECGEITQAFRKLGIYPEESLSTIPDYYLANTDIDEFKMNPRVKSIGCYAFGECFYLTSITIPDSVTSIDDWAFSFCSSLTSVVIPNNVTEIGEEAFSNCSGLKSVTLPNSIINIGKDVFYKCRDLNITYNGTKEQWKNLSKGQFKGVTYTCNCSDGTIKKSR